MNIVLGEQTQRLLEERMKKGGYRTPEEAVRAGLTSLEQREREGEFETGELASLLAVADAEIERGELIDGEDVFREIRELSSHRKTTG